MRWPDGMHRDDIHKLAVYLVPTAILPAVRSRYRRDPLEVRSPTSKLALCVSDDYQFNGVLDAGMTHADPLMLEHGGDILTEMFGAVMFPLSFLIGLCVLATLARWWTLRDKCIGGL